MIRKFFMTERAQSGWVTQLFSRAPGSAARVAIGKIRRPTIYRWLGLVVLLQLGIVWGGNSGNGGSLFKQAPKPLAVYIVQLIDFHEDTAPPPPTFKGNDSVGVISAGGSAPRPPSNAKVPVMVINGTDPVTAKTIKLVTYTLPENQLFSQHLAPLLKTMKKGDYLRLSVFELKGGNAEQRTLSTDPRFDNLFVGYEQYSLNPGETRPNVYLFVSHSKEKIGATDSMVVEFLKLGSTGKAMLPNTGKDANGKPAPDPKMLQTVETLAPKELVEVTLNTSGPTPTLRSIERWDPLHDGTVVQVTSVEVDGVKTAAVEVKFDKSTVTLLVPGKTVAAGKWVADPTLQAAVTRLKEGDVVTVRYAEKDKNPWLKEVTVKTPAPVKLVKPGV